ncbi:MAG: transcriptional regulator [Candidatus Staskawiczbacteria bacterium RIFCSPHIGHO2_02_FULL_34_9]|uniref:Probable transcriptional regulatory protein A3D35_00040 n=1 Tax=Candidatus Staskawiczbacteria bacterium RIFCSPHIGHO2_02_FULL_34_9 TaxID=1802206 RepID=A0A1G2HYY6_9BACT|nr:MAG: transcriptional regulator [Candidatus Staskawiczbacteria bacterium RIFCSPHIGHO2_02_FULL_34_9]
MSGHSHFKTVKATKDANDAKKGKIFSKIGRVITIAVKEGGKDPIMNAKLKTLIDKAKEFNMPKENIERAIKKGAGELGGETLENISIEGFGPSGITLIVEGITDNKNRALTEIKTILNKYQGKMAGEGAVKWMFDRKGVITIELQNNKEELELLAIESGAEDVIQEGNLLYIHTNPEDLEKVKKTLEDKNVKIESSILGWIAKEEVDLDEKEKESCQKLFEALDENDDVQEIYSNIKG